MTEDIVKFNPTAPIVGGALIGLSTAYNAVFFGKVTGVSGLVNKAVRVDLPSTLFLAGIGATRFVIPNITSAVAPVDVLSSVPLVRLAVAGALVGAGTRVGNGCTSGHGVSGLARGSKRSLAAVASFLVSGIATATLTSSASLFPLLGTIFPAVRASWGRLGILAALPGALGTLCRLFRKKNAPDEVVNAARGVTHLSSGLLFGAGIAVSGMLAPGAVASFLDVRSSNWDISLPTVMASAVSVAFLGFQFAKRLTTGVATGDEPDLPKQAPIDQKLVLGAALFGAGWGLSGVCVGPALEYLSLHPKSSGALCFLSSMLISSAVADQADEADA